LAHAGLPLNPKVEKKKTFVIFISKVAKLKIKKIEKENILSK